MSFGPRLLSVLSLAVVLGPLAARAHAQSEPWRTINHEAAVLFRAGKYAESEALSRQGLETCRTAGPTAVFCASIFWEILAQDAEGEHQPVEAEAAYRRSLAIRQAGLPETHPLVADSLERLGGFLVQQGRPGDAQPYLAQAIAILRAGAPSDSGMLINTLGWLAQAQESAGSAEDALPARREAASVADATQPPGSATWLLAQVNLATTLSNAGHFDEALRVAVAGAAAMPMTGAAANVAVGFAITASVAASRLDTPKVALGAIEAGLRRVDDPSVTPQTAYQLLLGAGRVRQGMGDTEGSAPLLERAWAKAVEAFGETSTQVAEAMESVGRSDQERGQFEAAAAAYADSERIFEQTAGADSPRVAEMLDWQAGVAADMGEFARAEQYSARELVLLDQQNAAPERRARAERLASTIHSRLGDGAGAERFARSAVRRLDAMPAAPAVDRLFAAVQLANVEVVHGDLDQARILAAAARRLVDQPMPRTSRQTAIRDLASLLYFVGDSRQAAELARRFVAEASNEDAVRPVDAGILSTLGNAEVGLGDIAEGEQDCARAVALTRPLPGKANDGWLTAMACLAQAQSANQKLADAARTDHAILAALGGTGSAANGSRMRALEGLGAVARQSGDYAGSLRSLDAAIALAEAGKETSEGILADSLGLRGSVRRRMGRYSEAASDFTRSLAVWEHLGGGDTHRAEALNGLGLTRLDEGDPKGAEAPLRQALALRLKAGLDGAVLESRANVAMLRSSFGNFAAAADLAAVTAKQEALGWQDRPVFALTLERRGQIAELLGRSDEAEALFRRALDINTRVFGPDNPAQANLMLDLARRLDDRDERQEASRLRENALAIIAEVQGEDSQVTAQARLALVPELEQTGQYGRVHAIVDACVAATERAYGPDSPGIVPCLTTAADVELTQRRLPEAARDAERAQAIQTRILGADNPALAGVLLQRARIALARNAPNEAMERCAEADIALGTKAPLSTAVVRMLRARAEQLQGAPNVAEASARSALAMTGNAPDAAAVRTRLAATTLLASLLVEDGKAEPARQAWQALLDTKPPPWAQAAATRGLASTLLATGQPEAAAAAFEHAAAMSQAAADRAGMRADLSAAAIALAIGGRFDEAASTLVQPGLWDDPVGAMMWTATLATIAQSQGALIEAATYFARLLGQQEAMFGTDSPALLPTLVHLARLDLAVGLRPRAEALARRAEALALRDPAASAIELEQLRGALASDPAEAEARMHHAIALAAGPLGSPRARAAARAQLGEFYSSQFRFAEAKRELEGAGALFTDSDGPKSVQVGGVLAALATAADGQGDTRRAAEYRAGARAILGNAHAVPSLRL